jgi:hypothetical protein
MELDGFQGAVIEPGDDDYETARQIWNGHIDRRPAVIAPCRGTADVGSAVEAAGSGGSDDSGTRVASVH